MRPTHDIAYRVAETGIAPAQVFISYQWDIQDDIQSLRDRLERAGFSCWMDIGQMGAGDQLNVKIDEGIRKSKVCNLFLVERNLLTMFKAKINEYLATFLPQTKLWKARWNHFFYLFDIPGLGIHGSVPVPMAVADTVW